MKTLFSLILLSFFSVSAQAKTFTSPFITFQLPSGFSCQNYSGTWNCKKPNSAKHKGFIAVTAKKARVGTTLSGYKNKLLKPITRNWNKKIINSQPQVTDEVIIRGQKWIQSTHLDGEVPNSMTKYLITIKNGLSVLVSFTAHTDDYPILSPDFIRAIESMKLSPKLKSNMAAPIKPLATNSAPGLNSGNELDDIFEEDPTQSQGGGQLTISSLKKIGALALLIIAALLFLISRRKNK